MSDAMQKAWMVAVIAMGLGFADGLQQNAAAQRYGAQELEVDNLRTPLGIDDGAPSFSWQLNDPARGAKQTAYEVLVATDEDESAEEGKTVVWDSGRVEGGQSMNVRYAGPALGASTRYFWRVKVWGADGAAYESAESWFETGLAPQQRGPVAGDPATMSQSAWRAGWIGYETAEEAAVRAAAAKWVVSPEFATQTAAKGDVLKFAFRTTVQLDKPVKRAALYATAQDTVGAWVNGTQVMEAEAFPAWHQMPWKKFVRADVTAQMAAGKNVVAIEQVNYTRSTDGPPVIATLVVEFADGTMATFGSDERWKSAVHAAEGWQQKGFDDGGWKTAAIAVQTLGHPWIPDSVKELRYVFSLDGPVKSARLYATALGAYEMTLNDTPVDEGTGEQWFKPGWTDYRERVIYQTYDVTDVINQQQPTGRSNVYDHILTALLAPGWYETPLEWFQQPNNYGDTPPALRAQLRIEHTDGRVEWITTDEHWQARTTGILKAELYDGETEDKRLWGPLEENAVGSAAHGWSAVESIHPAEVKIEAQGYQPIRVERNADGTSVKGLPVARTEPKPGVYVYDFGQNFAGVEQLRVSGPRGTDVRVRFAELLNDDGTIYTDNLRTAKATDHFILDGNGMEEFVPHFTFHGFRYAEVTGLSPHGQGPVRGGPGLPSAPGKDALTALVIHTDAPFAAELKTGSAMINKLWSNIEWGQRSNFVGVPTDCPQRDERLGWMADAQVFWRTAMYNMDLAAFTRKFAADMRGTQAGTPYFGIYAPGTASEHSSGSGAGWSDAGVVIPWTSWLQTGDTRVVEENWAAMEKYLAAIDKANPDGLWRNESGIPFGDWLSPEGRTDQVLIATAYWAYDVTLMREMAHATGRTGDEEKYAQEFEKIRAAFEKQFVHEDGFVAGVDKGSSQFGERTKTDTSGEGDTQTGYVLALHMNLMPEALRRAAAKKLADKIEANHGLLGTGFLGTPYLLEELTKTGHADLAYKLLLNTQYPSWGYLVEHGATTMWERWNGDQMKADPSMNSYNHYAYGAVADWIYRYAAGVDVTPQDAGFHTVVLHPVFDARLGSVEFSYPSGYGVIRSDWTVQGGIAEWKVTLPANTTGWLALDAATAAKYTLGGVALAQSKVAKAETREGQSGYVLEAGSYAFTVLLR
jgi:alpha-L-rhamnosidase